VRHRLDPLIQSAGLNDYEDLVTHLNRRDATALRTSVIDAITVKESAFFRDQGCWDGLSRRCAGIRPAAATPGHTRHQIRIWSAATATGQEAYSVAMLIRDSSQPTAGRMKKNSAFRQ